MLAALVLLVSVPLLCSAQILRDEFSTYPEGGDAGPNWETQSAGWEVADGAYVGDGGVALWRAVPFASAVTFACDVTVLELHKGDWLVVGLGITADDQNYWGLRHWSPRRKHRAAGIRRNCRKPWMDVGSPPASRPRG